MLNSMFKRGGILGIYKGIEDVHFISSQLEKILSLEISTKPRASLSFWSI
jgi:hypothetical protein